MSIDAFLDTLTDEQKAALLKALTKNNAVEETNNQPKEEDKNQFIAQTKKVQPNQRRKEPVRAKQNTWTDTGEDRNIETPKYEPTPRTREKVEKVSIKCHACGKSFDADPRFVYGEYYRCDRCASRK
jgi:DNA-directed RNA polymerase subunit RPC12/RpoP